MTVEQFCDTCVDAQSAMLVGIGAQLHELPNPAGEPVLVEQTSVNDPSETNGRSVNGRLLLIDDHEAVRSMMHALLVTWNYAVTAAVSASEALAILRSGTARRFDLLVTDVEMPEMSGIELVAAVLDEQPDLRVLFISGQAEGARERATIDWLGLPFLAKPFTEEELHTAVQRALRPIDTAGASSSTE